MTIKELKNAVAIEAASLMSKDEMTGRTADDLKICVSLDGNGHRNNYWYYIFKEMVLTPHDSGEIDEIRITENGMVYINIKLF